MTLKHFKLSEFDQPGLEGSGANMDGTFLQKLDNLRAACNFPFKITSGYRTPEYNQKVSNTGSDGPHVSGRACDIAVSGERALKIVALAQTYGFTGIGIKQHGPHEGRFVHLDDLERPGYPRPTLWSYP